MIIIYWLLRRVAYTNLVLQVLAVAALGVCGCKTSRWGGDANDNPQWPEYASVVNDGADTVLPFTGETEGIESSGAQALATSQVSPVGYVVPGSSPVLKVRNVKPQSGPLRVAVFSDPAAFPNPQQASTSLAIPSQSSSVESPLSVNPSQTFAVAVYQDLNNDGVLNRSSFGIPSEPYGFSHNAVGKFGPPSFEDAAIKPGDTSALEINLR